MFCLPTHIRVDGVLQEVELELRAGPLLVQQHIYRHTQVLRFGFAEKLQEKGVGLRIEEFCCFLTLQLSERFQHFCPVEFAIVLSERPRKVRDMPRHLCVLKVGFFDEASGIASLVHLKQVVHNSRVKVVLARVMSRQVQEHVRH